MIDSMTIRGKIIAAALALAAERPWGEVELVDIAERAGLRLIDLKGEIDSKSAIVVAFTTLVDDEMLRLAPRRAEGQSARDALFEVIMSRFDLLMPYRTALKSIIGSGVINPAQLGAVMTTQHWMLAAAGVTSEGLAGSARTLGLASVYASVFRVWVEDEDPGQARTMAALDRRLRRGETALSRIEEACAGLQRIVGSILPRFAPGRKSEQPAPPPV